MKERYPAFLTFSPYGEMLPNKQSFVDLDYDKHDTYGLPMARRQYVWGENDKKIFADMQRWSVEILKSAGARDSVASPRSRSPIMSWADAAWAPIRERSVVNADCRTHDVPNLYVVDGSVFPSASEKNPTHTIMALAARAADHIADTHAERRECRWHPAARSLKIIGAIGATCAFPFSADELYGQHVHRPAATPADSSAPYKPQFFSAKEFETLSRLADAIIPATDTPGPVEAGVPRYIEEVVMANPEHKKHFRVGLSWMDAESKRRFGAKFAKLNESQQFEILTPLSEAVDAGHKLNRQEQFFQLMKNLTADGYYTSQIGLVRELGYAGNTVLEKFPAANCRNTKSSVAAFELTAKFGELFTQLREFLPQRFHLLLDRSGPLRRLPRLAIYAAPPNRCRYRGSFMPG